MRFMIIVKASPMSEAESSPVENIDETLVEEMDTFHKELKSAGALLDGAGLKPSSKGWRVKYEGEKRTGRRQLTCPRSRPIGCEPPSRASCGDSQSSTLNDRVPPAAYSGAVFTRRASATPWPLRCSPTYWTGPCVSRRSPLRLPPP